MISQKLRRIPLLFFALFALFFPLDFLGSFQLKLTGFLFRGSVFFLAKIFGCPQIRIDFSSDSVSLYLLCAILLVVSFIFSLSPIGKFVEKYAGNFKTFLRFYLAAILLKYGLDKVFCMQFYAPHSNLLFTKFGDLDRDILYWSVMGTSKFHSVFLGICEVFSAALLLFERTKKLGIATAFFIISYILVINLSFDISVKLFSLTLLVMSVFLLGLTKENVKNFIQKYFKNNQNLERRKPVFYLKYLVFLPFSIIILMPYFKPRDKTFLNDSAFRVLNQNSAVKNIFFNEGYLIFQNQNDEMTDFHLAKTEKPHQFLMEKENRKPEFAEIIFDENSGKLYIKSSSQNLTAEKIHTENMNANRPIFHLFSDFGN